MIEQRREWRRFLCFFPCLCVMSVFRDTEVFSDDCRFGNRLSTDAINQLIMENPC